MFARFVECTLHYVYIYSYNANSRYSAFSATIMNVVSREKGESAVLESGLEFGIPIFTIPKCVVINRRRKKKKPIQRGQLVISSRRCVLCSFTRSRYVEN